MQNAAPVTVSRRTVPTWTCRTTDWLFSNELLSLPPSPNPHPKVIGPAGYRCIRDRHRALDENTQEVLGDSRFEMKSG